MSAILPSLPLRRIRPLRVLPMLVPCCLLGAQDPGPGARDAAIRELRTFLRAHPAHAEARNDLLRILMREALDRARTLPPGAALTPAQDLDLWGPYAQELDQAFITGAWLAWEGDEAGDPVLESRSPTLQALKARHLPKVETRLAALPGALPCWRVAMRLGGPAFRSRGQALLQSLAPLPAEARLDWPPKGIDAVLAPGPARRETPARGGDAGDLAALTRDLAKDRGALLLLLDPEPEAAGLALAELAAEAPLLPLGLRTKVAVPGAVAGIPALPAKDAAATRWLLLGPAGIAAEGTGMPTAGEVRKAFDASPCRSRLEVLEDYVATHPQRLDAVTALLHARRDMGDRATRHALGNTQRPEEPGPEPFHENHAPLGEEDDAAIWGPYAHLLVTQLPELLPLAGRLPLAPESLIPECIWASATLQEAARTLLPEVERALANRPRDLALWAFWTALHASGEGRSVTALLEDLQPSPLAPKGSWPPPALAAVSFQDCRDRADWKELAERAAPAWKELAETARTRNRDLLNPRAWASLAEPYLEALVRLHRIPEADQLLRTWMALSPWKGAATAAQAIALDCGEEPLMQRWCELLTP